MKGLLPLMALGILLCASGPVDAGTLYAIRETDNTLVTIDTDTLQYKIVGPLGVGYDFGDLAWKPASNTLYMLGGRPNQGLYTVNMSNGQATLVGMHNLTDLFALGYDSRNAVLYAAQFITGGGFYRMNESNGSATLIGNLSHRLGGMTYNTNTDQLIAIEDGAGDIYEVNRSNGALTLLYDGPYTNNSDIAYDWDKNVYWDIDWNGNLYKYDIAAGYARTTVLSGLGPHDGLAYIPEPSAIALLAAMTLLALRRR